MNQDNNFVNPDYNEGTPRSGGNIVDTYTVEEKDTLADVANKFGMSVEDLLAANRDTIPDLDHMIQTGTRLMIPKKGSS